MDEFKASERQYESDSKTIEVSPSDFESLSSIQTIEEGDLQSYLLGEALPTNTDDKDLERIDEKKATKKEQVEDKPKSKKKEKEELPNVDEYLSEKEEENDTPPEKDKPDTKSDEDDENIFVTLNRDLIKANIFGQYEDEDITDAASFKDKFIREMNRGANSIVQQYLSRFGPDYAEAFEAIFDKGVHPRTYLSQFERIQEVEGMDIKDPEVQELIMKQYYQSQGLDKEKVNAKIQKLKDYGDLEEDAERIHSLMVKDEKRRLQEEEEEAQIEQERVAELKRNYHVSLQKILTDKMKAKSFNGIPIDNNKANRIFSQLTVDAYRLPNGQTITEFDNKIMQLNRPENFEKKVLLAMLLDNDLDLSTIKKEAIKTENNDIFEGLQRAKKKKEISNDNAKSFFS